MKIFHSYEVSVCQSGEYLDLRGRKWWAS